MTFKSGFFVTFPTGFDSNPKGPKDAKGRLYPIITLSGVITPLNTQGITISPVNIAVKKQKGASKFSITEVTPEYIGYVITNDSPVASDESLGFTWRFGRAGQTYDYGGVALLDVGQEPKAILLTSIKDLVPNSLQKAMFTASIAAGVNWSYWITEGAKFISGFASLRVASNNTTITTIDITGLTPDQLNRYIQEITTTGVEQKLVIASGVLGCPRYYNGPIYGVTPVACQELSIPVPEGSYDSYAMPFEKLNNKGDNYVIIGIKEQGENKFSGNTISNFKATGPLTSASAPSKNLDGSFVINAITNGNNGEILVTADITGPAPENRVYKYNKKLLISGNDLVVITPKTIDVKVWDQLDAVPFSVVLAGTDVTSEIRNVKLIPNEYIIVDPEDPTKWTVDTAPNAGASKSTFFTFEVNVGGNWKPKVAYGTYRIAAWSGKALEIETDGIIGASPLKETTYVIKPKYKKEPIADRIEVILPTNPGFIVTKLTPSEDNTELTITIKATVVNGSKDVYNPITTVNGIGYKLKDSPGANENIDVVHLNAKLFSNGDYLALYGTIEKVGGPYGALGAFVGSSGTAEVYVYINGERISLNDYNLSVYFLDNGNNISSPSIKANAFSYIGGDDTTLYVRITKPRLNITDTNHQYYSPWAMLYKEGGVNDQYKCVTRNNFWVNPTTSTEAPLLTLYQPGEVKPGIENTIRCRVSNNGTLLEDMKLLTGKLVPVPENCIDTTKEFSVSVDPNDNKYLIIKFTATTVSGNVYVRGGITAKGVTGIPVIADGLAIPKATLIAEPIDTEFNGVEGAETEMKFKVTLTGKPVTGVVVSKGGIATGGAPASAKDFKEIGDGVYSVVVVGGGHEGKGFVTFFLSDGTTENQVPLEPIYGVIDSSNFKLDLTPTDISGKKGDRITLTGSLTNGETNFKFDDSSVAWSFDPADTISKVSVTADTMVVQIDKEVPYDQVVPVKVQVSSKGLKTETTINVTLTGALVVTVLEPKVDVWFSTANPPLKFMLGDKDVTSSVNAISFVETSLVKHNGLKGGYQIISDKAIPTTKQNVSYTYKYAADTPEVNVEVPFTINEYDGKELVLTAEVPPNYRGESGEWIMYSGGFSSMQFSGKLRGVPVGALDFVSMPVGSGYCTPSGAMTYDNASGRSTMRFDFAKVGVAYTEVIVNLKLKGTPNNEIITNVNGGPARFRLTLVDSNKPFIVSDTVPGRVTGKLGDEMPMEIIAYYNDKQVALNDPKVTISKPTDPRIEIVPGSITKNGLKLRFTEDTDVTYIGNNVGLTITYVDPKNVKQTANTSFSFQHVPFYEKLEMVDGFQTSGEGTDTIVLTQAVKNPTK
ncbi:hypothetical protein N1M2_161 [Klebsiella phage N1M2]|uniref:Uncharacterized protein n=1 Tax=Klebsiella phage N1M2 TaxID=2664939 RepID=A0A6B7ZFI9_9CAUD|nr:hypothetical protein PQB72_gp161 [Klebsiella phage N1M2]QGH72024.1 hypothetical protein N1M2_161 [Klebsiella phage N1M2]